MVILIADRLRVSLSSLFVFATVAVFTYLVNLFVSLAQWRGQQFVVKTNTGTQTKNVPKIYINEPQSYC